MRKSNHRLHELHGFHTNSAAKGTKKGERMLDLIFILLVLAFFAAALWYVRFCERA